MAAPGGGAPFDFSALSSVLNDPSIREMAESIANNPAFASMTQSLQASLLGGGGAAAGGEGASNADAAAAPAAAAAGAAAAPGAPGMPPIDPSKYAEVMSSVMGNPDFLTMAEKLGKQIMAVSAFFCCSRHGDGDDRETAMNKLSEGFAASPGVSLALIVRQEARGREVGLCLAAGSVKKRGFRLLQAPEGERDGALNKAKPAAALARHAPPLLLPLLPPLLRLLLLRLRLLLLLLLPLLLLLQPPPPSTQLVFFLRETHTKKQSDPGMASLMASMQSPDAASSIESRLASLKEDPELAPVLKEIESGGPTAMMKYWNDPAVLEKLSKAMGGAFGGGAAAALGAGAAAGGEEGGEGEEVAAEEGAAPTTVLDAATKGDSAALQKLIDGGAECNEADEEER